jgi:hypothetical protein
MKVLRFYLVLFFVFFVLSIIWDYEVRQGDLLFYSTAKEYLALLKEQSAHPMTNTEISEKISSHWADCVNEGLLHRIFRNGFQFDSLTVVMLIVVTFIIFKS